jgi:hypothetical protein
MSGHHSYKGTLPQAARDRRIIDAYLQGASLADVGEEYGISRERVRQILGEHRVATRTNVDTIQLKYEAWVAAHGAELDASFDALRSIPAVVETHPESSAVWIRRYLADRAWEQAPARRRARWIRRFSDDDLRAILRRCAVDGRITIARYEHAKRSTDPTVKTFLDRFGSWAKAARSAGLTVGETRRAYASRWDDDAIRAALAQYAQVAAAYQQRPTIRGYEEYRVLEAPELPSMSLVRSRLGGSISAILNGH